MADNLAQKVQHSEVKIVFFDLSIAYFEVMEKGNDEILKFLLVVEIQVVGVGIDKRDDSA